MSPRSASGRVRGRPGPSHGTRSAASSGSSWVESPACPGVTQEPGAGRGPSTSAWVLVVSPPRDRRCRDRPVRRYGPAEFLSFDGAPCMRQQPRRRPPARRRPAGGRGVLMHPRHGRVHADPPVQLTVRMGLRLQRRQQPVPRAVGREPMVALPHRLPRPELRWQIAPRHPGAVPVGPSPRPTTDDPSAVAHGPVAAGATARSAPHHVGQHLSARHTGSISLRPRRTSAA